MRQSAFAEKNTNKQHKKSTLPVVVVFLRKAIITLNTSNLATNRRQQNGHQGGARKLFHLVLSEQRAIFRSCHY